VLVAEPNLREHAEFELKPYEDVVSAADIVLLLVDHREFRDLKAANLKEKILIDTRGVIV
jgi:UDP-N-acetyl-D-mannosaminuronic acid dehydrogenase